MFSTGFTSFSAVSYFFFLYRLPFPSLCAVFDYMSSDINVVLSINPSDNIFVFEDFSVHHRDWLTYFGKTYRPGVSVSIDLPTSSKRDTVFHGIAYDYSRADWDGLRNHLRDVPWEDIFKLSASAATK